MYMVLSAYLHFTKYGGGKEHMETLTGTVKVPYSVVLRVWSLHRQHQHYLRSCWKCQFLGPNPRSADSDTLGLGLAMLHFRKPSRWFWYMLTFENHCLTLDKTAPCWNTQPGRIQFVWETYPPANLVCSHTFFLNAGRGQTASFLRLAVVIRLVVWNLLFWLLTRFHSYFLSNYYMSGNVLGSANTGVKRSEISAFMGFTV